MRLTRGSLSLGLINLLELLTELRETFYLLDHWFIIKRCNWDINRGKRCTGQSMRKGHEAFMPSPGIPLSQHLHVFTTQKPSEPCHLGFLWRFHYIGIVIKSLAIGNWFKLQPILSLRRLKNETKSSNSPIVRLVPPQAAPILRWLRNIPKIAGGSRWWSRKNLSFPLPSDTPKLQLNIKQLFLRMTWSLAEQNLHN